MHSCRCDGNSTMSCLASSLCLPLELKCDGTSHCPDPRYLLPTLLSCYTPLLPVTSPPAGPSAPAPTGCVATTTTASPPPGSATARTTAWTGVTRTTSCARPRTTYPRISPLHSPGLSALQRSSAARRMDSKQLQFLNLSPNTSLISLMTTFGDLTPQVYPISVDV